MEGDPCHSCSSTSCIARVPLFAFATPEEQSALLALVQSRSYVKGSSVFRQGEPSDSLYVVRQGILKLTRLADNGKEQVLRFLFPGELFGQSALLQEGRHYANAEAMETSVICNLHRDDVGQLLEHNAALSYRFMLAFAERLQQADEWMGANNLLEVEQRLAKVLLHFARSTAEPVFRLPVAKKELASLIGTTPETLSRKLAALAQRKLLETAGRGALRLLDRGELVRLAGGA